MNNDFSFLYLPIFIIGLVFVSVMQRFTELMHFNRASGVPPHGNRHPYHLLGSMKDRIAETPCFVVSLEVTLAAMVRSHLALV